MNLQVQLDGGQKVELDVRVTVYVPPGVRLVDDGGLKLAPPLGIAFGDDGTGRVDFDEQAIEAELRRHLLGDQGDYLWSFEAVEVKR